MPEIIPHSVEAEEVVIGAVLYNPEVYLSLHFLKVEDFYIHRFKWVWSAFSALHQRRVPIDPVTVAAELEQRGQLGEFGGAAGLTALLVGVPDSLNAEHYGRIVGGYAVRRKIIEAANEAARLAYNTKLDLQKVTDGAVAAMYAAADRQEEKAVTLGAAMSAAYDQSTEAARQGGLVGISTGFPDLDDYIGGLKRGKVYYVGGRPGRGKSALVVDFAVEAAFNHQKRVRIFSLEMGAAEVAIRVAAKRLNIDSKRIEDGNLTSAQWEQYQYLMQDLQDYEQFPITIDNTLPLTPLTLNAICQRELLRNNLDLLIVDYAQLMQGEGANLREQVTDVSRNIKRLTVQLNIPVVGAVQLSRNAETGDAKVSDLQETGALEQDADVVMLLNAEDKSKGFVDLHIAKQRGGPTGNVYLKFRRHLTKFESAATGQQVAQEPGYVQESYV